MLKENERLYSNFRALVDVIITLLAITASYYIRIYAVAKEVVYTDQYLILALLIIPVWYILIKVINFQSAEKVKNYSVIFLEYSVIIVVGIILLFVFIFIFKLDKISRLALLLFAVINLFLLFSFKVIILKAQKKRHLKGKNVKQTILIADESSLFFIEQLRENKHLGYSIAGIITEDNALIEKYNNQVETYSPKIDIQDFLEQNVVDEVIYCKGEIDNQLIKGLIFICEEMGITFQLQSDFFSLIASKSQLNYYGEIPLMTFANKPSDYIALSVKKVFDQIFSFMVLVFFLPVAMVIAIAIRIESKGKVFFKQERVGLNGRLFTIYKFRTMIQDAEKYGKKLESKNEVDGPVFKIKNDPRVTKVGRFLRQTSLDEFPQFLNVLKGDMAVVGPRPPIPSEVSRYTRLQRRRLSMRPGITCLWQVSGRNELNFNQWMRLDLQYIDNWSLRLDFILVLKTINTILKRTGY